MDAREDRSSVGLTLDYQRDQLWESSFTTYYDVYYEELLAEGSAKRWQYIDEVVRVLVAITASGLAVSAWTLWNHEGLRFLWSFLAGAIAVLSIAHAVMEGTRRVRDFSSTHRSLAHLRVDLETFRQRLQLDPEFDVDKYIQEFVALRGRFAESIDRARNDILEGGRFRALCQRRLNECLVHEIQD